MIKMPNLMRETAMHARDGPDVYEEKHKTRRSHHTRKTHRGMDTEGRNAHMRNTRSATLDVMRSARNAI